MTRSRTDDAASVIDRLFEDEPPDEAALKRALGDVAPVPVRRELVKRLRDPEIERWQAAMTGVALRVLGVGDEREALVSILADRSLPDYARSAAITAFESLTPEQMRDFVLGLPQDAADALQVLPMIDMVSAVQEDPENAQDIPEVLLMIDAEGRPEWLSNLATVRRQLGVRAADLYRYALAEPEIALDDRLREPMLKALIEEADEAGAELIQALRAKAPKRLRAPFQEAFVRLETARVGVKPRAAPIGIEAFASNPDGQGALVVFVSFRNPDGSFTLANVCLRLTEDVRNGLVEPRASRSERESLIRDYCADGTIELVAAPPGEVARLVAEAVARTKAMGRVVPSDARRSVELIARVAPAAAPPPAPGRSLSVERVAAILDRPRHVAWFFDLEDLTRFGAKPPRAGLPSAWKTDALNALARSPMRERVIAMARYMSRWSSWRGDADEAAEWTTLTEGAERDFANSPLAFVMFMKFLDPGPITERLRDVPAAVEGPAGMEAFSLRFPEVAAKEMRTFFPDPRSGLPEGAYELHEFYCVDPACDCKRVLFHVYGREQGGVVATISHGFSAKEARAAGFQQTFLDPMHGSAPFADAVLGMVEESLRHDAAWHQRLENHYAMVKRDVLKTMPVAAPVRRAGPKIGPNEPCPCGSGKKYKKCCGR